MAKASPKKPRVRDLVQNEHSASSTVTMRIRMRDEPNSMGKVTSAIGRIGLTCGNFANMRMVAGDKTEFDLTIYIKASTDVNRIRNALKRVQGVSIQKVSDPTFLAHLGGVVKVGPTRPIINADDLCRIYTPGVGRIVVDIRDNPQHAWNLTQKGNSILVVTDGTRILGYGDVGPCAGLPVMEGKAAIFAQFGGVSAVPMPLATKSVDEIVQACVWMAPAYGGINLEDIESPKCYDVERKLKAVLDIPVFHDDQHGTAIVVLAGALNAARLVGKKLKDMKVVLSGVGAAGMASGKLLIKGGVRNLIGFKKEGPLYVGRPDMEGFEEQKEFARMSNPTGFTGTLKEAMKGADMFVGLSAANVISARDIKRMAKDAIVFALANPLPEVNPMDAWKVARIVATGSSQWPNQVNNALVFPGIFRGALDARVRDITEPMKLAAARALARTIKPSMLREHKILPDVFDMDAHKAVAEAVKAVAYRTGVARRERKVR